MSDAAFFVSGGTLPLSAGSYVERAADRVLLDALLHGRYAYVLNARQMGKSSLCVRTVARLEAMGARTAFVDLTRIGGRNVTPDQWYVGLLGEIGRGIGGRAEMVRFWKENGDLSPMQRFFGALATCALPEGSAPLVVFVDEVDATRSLPFSADEFFGGIRECFNRRAHDPQFERLTFCLLGAAIPSDLIRDMEASPFNVGERIAVRDFTQEEAMAFAAGLGADGAALVRRTLHWTGGHPFLTQSLCARLAETDARLPVDVDRLVEADLFAPSARESNVNLADVGNRVLLSSDGSDPDRHRAEVLALYDRIRKGRRVEDDESNPRVAILKLAGLVVAEGGLLRVRNRVYARVFGPAWVAEHMPDGEARRVRRAYRVGLLRAAAAGAALLMVVGALGASAAGNARRAEEALRTARQETKRALDAETRATASAKEATDAKDRTQAALGLAEGRRRDAVAATARATASGNLERLARRSAQTATERERAASQAALASARKAVAAGQAERVAAREAQSAARVAQEKTLVALAATKRAGAARDEAEGLAYSADMQIVSAALAAGNGLKADQALRDVHAPGGKPSWAERHYGAVLDSGQILGGHRGSVGRVAFAPDGDLLTLDGFPDSTNVGLYSNGLNPLQGTVRRWSRATGRLVGAMSVTDVAGGLSIDLAPDGRTVAVSTVTGPIRLFSTDGFRPTGVLPGNGQATRNLLLTSVPGRALGCQGRHLEILDMATGYPLEDLGAGSYGLPYWPPNEVTLTPEGGLLRRSGENGGGLLSRDRTPEGHYRTRWETAEGAGTLDRIVVAPGGRRIATSSIIDEVRVLDADTGSLVGPLVRVASPGSALAFDALGERLAVGLKDGTVEILRVGTDDVTDVFPGRHGEVAALAFSPDGASLAIGTKDGTAVRRALEGSDAAPAGRTTKRAPYNAMGLSHDGSLLAGIEGTQTIRLVDPRGDRALRTLTGPVAQVAVAVVVSADGGTVASMSDDAHLRTWDAKTGRALADAAFPPAARKPWVKGLALSPDGQRAVVFDGGGGTVNAQAASTTQLVEARSGRELAPPIPGVGWVGTARFSPDGGQFVVAWQTGLVRAFDGKTGRPLWSLASSRGVWTESVAYSPDGLTVAVGRNDGSIDLCDARTGRLHLSWSAQSSTIFGLAFSADGGTVLSGSLQGLLFWDARTGRSLGGERLDRTDTTPTEIAALKDGTVHVLTNLSLSALYAPDHVQARPLASVRTSDQETSLATARERARVAGRNVILVLRNEIQIDDDEPLTLLLADPEAAAILRRRFELATASGSSTRPGTGEREFKALLGEYLPSGIYVLRPDGRLIWDDRPDEVSAKEHGHYPVGAPTAEWEIETFLRALRRGSPTMTEGEVESLRRVLRRNGEPIETDDAAMRSEAERVGKSLQASGGGAAWDTVAWAAIVDYQARNLMGAKCPYIALGSLVARRYARAGALAKSGDPQAAADLLAETFRRIDLDPTAYEQIQFALALYGIAHDLRDARRLADSIRRVPAKTQVKLFGLVPGMMDDPSAFLAATPPATRDDTVGRYDRARLEVRTGRYANAEAEMRNLLLDKAADFASNAGRRRQANAIFALALAYQGKRDEARQALSVAEATYQGDTSDAALLKLGEYAATMFVLLRGEIRGLIGS